VSTIPQISPAEWRVMQLLWTRHPVTANEVVEALSEETQWNHRTIRTLLNRLVKKGALSFKKESREYLYSPCVSQSECTQAESRSFLSRVFGGALRPALATLIEDEELSPDDIAALKKLLDKKGKKNK